jgi:hypothetical protein
MRRLFAVSLVAAWTVAAGEVPRRAAQGSFSLVTYNIAGLPGVVSKLMPEEHTPLIGRLLNAFDLVLVQEDFAFHDSLVNAITLPYRSEPAARLLSYGDGLNRFSKLPFIDHLREVWEACHGIVDAGNDCLTPKGFDVATHELGRGAVVDVYNLHMDAGPTVEDEEARRRQVDQLARTIRTRSRGRAVIVAGDTNLRGKDNGLIVRLARGAGLSDSCAAVRCDGGWGLDRVFYRSSAKVVLRPKRWSLVQTFIDERGAPLSDHLPISVEFEWILTASR